MSDSERRNSRNDWKVINQYTILKPMRPDHRTGAPVLWQAIQQNRIHVRSKAYWHLPEENHHHAGRYDGYGRHRRHRQYGWNNWQRHWWHCGSHRWRHLGFGLAVNGPAYYGTGTGGTGGGSTGSGTGGGGILLRNQPAVRLVRVLQSCYYGSHESAAT
jgi:hypothetical protein